MKIINFSIILVILLTGCASTYHVISDQEKHVEFSKYQTYYIINPKDGFPAGVSPINRQRIERAISSEMKELKMTPNVHPDIVISWRLRLEEVSLNKKEYQFYGPWNSTSKIENRTYLQGILSIDLIDVKYRQVIWHGKTSSHVYEGMPKVEEKINAAVKSIFNKYKSDTKNQEHFVMH